MFEPTLVMSVLGVDPGKKTGLAIVDLHRTTKPEPTGLLPGHVVTFKAGTSVDWLDLAPVTREMLMTMAPPNDDAPIAVAMEKFIATRRTMMTQDTQAMEAIGAVKAVLSLLKAPDEVLTMQLPSAAKNVVTDQRLSQLGLRHARLDSHGKDALRHAVLRCVTYVRGS